MTHVIALNGDNLARDTRAYYTGIKEEGCKAGLQTILDTNSVAAT